MESNSKMFVKHFEIINCTTIAFSRCDSITPHKTVLSKTSLCIHDQVPPLRNLLPHETHTEIRKPACSWKTGRKVWSSVPSPAPPKDISLFKGNEGGSQGHFVSHLPGRRMPRCNRFCHCPSGTLGYKQLLALGWGCARRQGVRHQLLYRQSRVQGCQRTSQLLISPLSSITTILLKKKTALLLPSQV